MSALHAPDWIDLRHALHVVSGDAGGVAHAVAPHCVSQLPALHAQPRSALTNALYASVCASRQHF
jgi:hypothetical protein